MRGTKLQRARTTSLWFPTQRFCFKVLYRVQMLQLEGWALKESHICIFTCSTYAVGSGLLVIHSIYGFRMAINISNRWSWVPEENTSEPVKNLQHQMSCSHKMYGPSCPKVAASVDMGNLSGLRGIIFSTAYTKKLYLNYGLTAWTYFSLPSPTTTSLLLSGDHAMSLTRPLIGWYSYFSRCSFCVVSQIRTLPVTSTHHNIAIRGSITMTLWLESVMNNLKHATPRQRLSSEQVDLVSRWLVCGGHVVGKGS